MKFESSHAIINETKCFRKEQSLSRGHFIDRVQKLHNGFLLDGHQSVDHFDEVGSNNNIEKRLPHEWNDTLDNMNKELKKLNIERAIEIQQNAFNAYNK